MRRRPHSRFAVLVLGTSVVWAAEDGNHYLPGWRQRIRGHLAYDDTGAGKRPGVLVIHEWWGYNPYARKQAEVLAGIGYTAFALDMYGTGMLSDAKGFGFIGPDGGGPDIFVHHSSIQTDGKTIVRVRKWSQISKVKRSTGIRCQALTATKIEVIIAL